MINQILKQRNPLFCLHLMPSFDTHRYCFKYREVGKGDNLCTLKKDCLLCVAFSEDQKQKLSANFERVRNLLKKPLCKKKRTR